MGNAFEKVKEILGKLGAGTKKLIIFVLLAVICFAVGVAWMLNNKPYAVLFSGVSSDEASQIIGKLKEDGISYQYESNGDILVPEDILEQTKADLVYEGYPKSGFTYSTLLDNVDMMTTDSDKETYILYELQDRIGATICLFNGVKDAKVTLSVAKEDIYALSDNPVTKSSGAVTVIMQDGGSPSEKQVEAIQRLVSKAVPEMAMEDVVVIDGNGIEVSSNLGSENTATSSEGNEIAQELENKIQNKILNILTPIYGTGNVKVAVKGSVNMEKLLRETIEYTTPDKINRQDKTGIISNETSSSESSTGGTSVGGVAGTDSNSDISEYTVDEEGNANSTYESNAITKEYLVNQIREQSEVMPGVLEDVTISVVINGTNFGGLTEEQVISLIGNASGITGEDKNDKVMVASVPFYGSNVVEEEEPDTTNEPQTEIIEAMKQLPLWVYAVVGGLLLLLIIILLVVFTRRRRVDEEVEEDEEELIDEEEELEDEAEEEDTIEEEEDIVEDVRLEFKNERGVELRDNIRDFTEQNPEVVAQLIKDWLSGGEED